jgi:hypothetical protein
MDRSESETPKHDQRPRWRKRRIGVLIAGLGIIGFLLVFPLQVCRDWGFVCENTGSHKGYREWRSGIRSGEWYHESRLEQFVRQHYPAELKNRWTSYEGTGRNILGQPVLFGHGDPRLGMIMMTKRVFDRYVDTLDDAAKLNLYHVLVSGDQQAIQAEEKKIADLAIAQLWPLR